MPQPVALLKGTLDVLVLKALSWGDMHGFGILSLLEERSGGVLGFEDSAVYQALHRLEDREHVVAEWRTTENKRRARWYRLTAKGRQKLRSESDNWFSYAEAVTDILRSATQRG